MKDVAGRVCVVTGAGSGIGRALAVALARRGARVAASDIDLQRCQETVDICRTQGATAVAHRLDVSDRGAVLAYADAVAAELGPAALVVNNAGVGLLADLLEVEWDDLDWLVGVNLWGVVHGSKAFLPQLIETHGHLVNISSVYGLVGMPELSAYSAAKFGVRGFTEALRQEARLKGWPVQVSCVHPGGIRTGIARASRLPARLDLETEAQRFDAVARTSPEKAATAILRGVERGRARILVGADARLFELGARLMSQDAFGALIRRGARALEERTARVAHR